MLLDSRLAAWPVVALPLVVAVIACRSEVRAAEPLHQRIDDLISARMPSACRDVPIASDAEFLRRVYLDLIGRIPSSAEARRFFDDPSTDKRERLIDRLLQSPAHARHMADVLDVMLMERLPDKHVSRKEWKEYLRKSIADNKPWNVLVREILSADGTDPKTRPAAKFLLDREMEVHQVTRDVGRFFLGRDLRCAQCHDHPIVDDYTQAEYYGLQAFFGRSGIYPDKKKKKSIGEKADGETTYQSVFDPAKVSKTAKPQLPGRPPIEEPKPQKGKEYLVKPAKNVRPVPRYSRRAQLPRLLTDPNYTPFARASANRFWALLMGRGLVEPVDMDHSNNPPSHPELLDLLTQELVAMNFDLRRYLGQLARSQTYQRTSLLPAGGEEVPEDSFAVALLKPLSPEQLAWSMMQATGYIEAEALARKTTTDDPKLVARLSAQVKPFVSTFGSQPGQPEGQSFEATLDQALFLRNGALIQGWLNPRKGNLLHRLLQMKQPGEIADELYLSVLTRLPTSEERAELATYLDEHSGNCRQALQEAVWALLTSAEFRFNH